MLPEIGAGEGAGAMLDYLLLTPQDLITNSNVLMAFAFAISIIALSFMAGEFFSIPSIKGFAKAELYELGVSAAILALLLTFLIPNIGPFDLVARGFMVTATPTPGNSNPTPNLCPEWLKLHGPLAQDQYGYYAKNGNIAFGQANFFLGCQPKLYMQWNPFSDIPVQNLNGVMGSRLIKGYVSLMLTQMFTGLIAGFSTGIQVSLFKVLAVDVGLQPWVALGPLNQAHTTIVDLLGTAYAAIAAENMLLKFIESAALPIFLPFGLLLRAVPFTRKTGSTIIAVVVAAYFVFPVSILINQQIWELIVNPPPQPGALQCKAVPDSCSKDSECCSYDCRFSKSAGEKICTAPLTDFTGYRSIYSICQGNPTPAEIDDTLNTIAGEQDKRTLDLYFSGTATSTEPTKAEQKLRDGYDTILWQHTDSFWAFTKSLKNPMPSKTAQTVFSEIEMLIMDAGQYALLSALFVVISIVLSLTMLKDIAVLIGGEPRIFGLSKLV